MTSDSKNLNSRRTFLKSALVGAATLPILLGNHQNRAFAQNVPNKPLDLSDPMAKILNYVEDASKVDKSKHIKYAEGQNCKNCVLYLEGGKKVEGSEAEYGRCGLFTGGLVTAIGWCSSYAPKIPA